MKVGQVLDWLNEQLNNFTKDLVQKHNQKDSWSTRPTMIHLLELGMGLTTPGIQRG